VHELTFFFFLWNSTSSGARGGAEGGPGGNLGGAEMGGGGCFGGGRVEDVDETEDCLEGALANCAFSFLMTGELASVSRDLRGLSAVGFASESVFRFFSSRSGFRPALDFRFKGFALSAALGGGFALASDVLDFG
jgi:hypothetical protein